MAKNSQGSWIGTQAQPQYATYQTAGMLRPAQAPPAPTSPQATPLPAIDPVTPPTDVVLPPNWTPTSPAPWSGTELPPPPVAPDPVDRAPLVDAVLAATVGMARAPRTRSNKF